MDSQLSATHTALSLWTFPPMGANWASLTVNTVEDINIVDVSISCHIQLKVNLWLQMLQHDEVSCFSPGSQDKRGEIVSQQN